MEKVKTKKYFQNFFIISVLFHLMLLTLLNIQRVHKISFVKDYFVNKFPQVEIFNVQPKEIEPQQMEAKVYPQIKPVTDLVKVIKETGKEEPMGKMPIDERALLVKQVNSEPMDIKIDILKKGFNNEIAEEKEVSLFFNNAGINNGIEKNKSWINSGEENIIEEFNRKKYSAAFIMTN